MIETYKIMSGAYDEKVCNDLFNLQLSTTRGHSKKIYKQRTRLKMGEYAICKRVVDICNSFP